MYNLSQINENLQSFGKRMENKGFSMSTRLNYLAIYRHILEAEQMPKTELIERAKRIKPLVRVNSRGQRREFGVFAKNDRLVFIKPSDIHQSYLYNFTTSEIVKDTDGLMVWAPSEELQEVTSFTCYHRYGGYHGFFRPGIDEVLSQIPKSVDLTQVHAFEIKVTSLTLSDIYDATLDRHVSMVTLYKLTNGLPKQIAAQKVICSANAY